MSDIELIGKKLQSADPEERREAVVDLGSAGRDGESFLFHAICDRDWRVRKTAVEALVTLGGEEVLSGLIRTLSSNDNAGARNSAIEALVHMGSRAVDSLLASLGTPDPDVRKFIVDILGDIRDPRSVSSLIARLEDSDENIRVAAAEALGKIRDRRAVDSLLECLSRSKSAWLDYAAVRALGEIGDERSLTALMTALGRSTLREPVIEAIGNLGNISTLSPLIAGLTDPLRIVREVATTALSALYRKSSQEDRAAIAAAVKVAAGDQAVDYLEEMLSTAAGDLRKACIAALGWAGKESSIPKLVSLLREVEMEEAVAHSLMAIVGNKGGPLLAHLRDENPLVRRIVAHVLGTVDSQEAEGPLRQLLTDENGHVRGTAAGSLGRHRCRNAIPALLELLTDEYQNVQEAAITALALIGDESVLDRLVSDFASRNVVLRRNIALLLGKFSSSKAADALAFGLKDEEPDVRKAVVLALGNIRDEKALRSLMLAVTDDDSDVRMLAAEALGKTAIPGAADALISLLQDPDLWVRAAAARALEVISPDMAGKVLAAHLETASDIFLLAVIEVLGRIGAEDTLKPLLKLANHPDPEVRKTMLSSLSRYRWEEIGITVTGRLSDEHWSVRKAAVELLKQKPDPAAKLLLKRIADADPDGAVRAAAKEALAN